MGLLEDGYAFSEPIVPCLREKNPEEPIQPFAVVVADSAA